MCISEWKSFLETEYAKTHVPDWHNKLEHIQSSDSNDDQNSNCTESPQREEWMILADFLHYVIFLTMKLENSMIGRVLPIHTPHRKFQKCHLG